MQNAALYRRGIVLPVTLEAEAMLRGNEADSGTAVKILEIPNQAFFEGLWELDLFQEINMRCGSLIDDYEEEFLEPNQLEHVIGAVDAVSVKKAAQYEDIRNFLHALAAMASEGREAHWPLLFVL